MSLSFSKGLESFSSNRFPLYFFINMKSASDEPELPEASQICQYNLTPLFLKVLFELLDFLKVLQTPLGFMNTIFGMEPGPLIGLPSLLLSR